MPYAVGIALTDSPVTRERERTIPMLNHAHRRRVVALVAGLLACGGLGTAPVQAQSVPIIIPPIAPIIVGIPAGVSPVVVGIPGSSGRDSRHGVTWSTSGRADVDVDVDRHHGQAVMR
jgi:hypothetical protein